MFLAQIITDFVPVLTEPSLKIMNRYLSQRIIDIFPRIIKGKLIRFNPVLLAPRGQRPGLKNWY